MPVPVIMLTQEEYDGIMQRLAALESALPGRSYEVEALARRVQSLESTLSAYQKTMSDVTKLPVK
jgi:hypothetical protein